MKKYAIILSLLLSSLLPACGHHHGGGSSPPSPAPNPAAYTYTATVVAQAQPGFFSCAWNNGLYMGTYQDYDHKGHCYLCKLEGNRVVRLHTFPGESIYNIRSYPGYLMLPVEQGALWRYDIGGGYSITHPKHLRMGHYDFAWTPSGWVTSEKETITSQNRSQLWKNGQLLYETSEYTWKEFVFYKGKIYPASYYIHHRTEGGLVEVNPETGEARLVYSQVGTHCFCNGIDSLGRLLYALQHGASATIRTLQGPIQEVPDIPWRIKTIKNTMTTFMLAAEHGWRKGGPCYLYVLNTNNGLFEKKLQLPDAEPWDICQGPSGNQFYLVTRNEKEGNLGRVYLIERH